MHVIRDIGVKDGGLLNVQVRRGYYIRDSEPFVLADAVQVGKARFKQVAQA